MRRGRALALGAALALAGAGAGAARAQELYDAPEPGTYALPPIARVAERPLVDANGALSSFPGLAPGQVAVVAFIYRGCHDAGGCPAALALLRELDRKLAGDAARAGRVRLAAVSFDPARDTPARMAELRELMEPRGDWRFLAPADAAALAPLLRDFGQDALALPGGELRHVLKVFLVDDQRRVRNIYAPGNLRAELVLADVATVLGASP